MTYDHGVPKERPSERIRGQDMLLTPSEIGALSPRVPRRAIKIQASQSTPERQPLSAAEARTALSKIKELMDAFDEAFQEAVKTGDLARVKALRSELELRMASLRAWLLTSEASSFLTCGASGRDSDPDCWAVKLQETMVRPSFIGSFRLQQHQAGRGADLVHAPSRKIAVKRFALPQ